MEIVFLRIHNIAYLSPCLGRMRRDGEAGRKNPFTHNQTIWGSYNFKFEKFYKLKI